MLAAPEVLCETDGSSNSSSSNCSPTAAHAHCVKVYVVAAVGCVSVASCTCC